jgi:hypothetical protein
MNISTKTALVIETHEIVTGNGIGPALQYPPIVLNNHAVKERRVIQFLGNEPSDCPCAIR